MFEWLENVYFVRLRPKRLILRERGACAAWLHLQGIQSSGCAQRRLREWSRIKAGKQYLRQHKRGNKHVLSPGYRLNKHQPGKVNSCSCSLQCDTPVCKHSEAAFMCQREAPGKRISCSSLRAHLPYFPTLSFTW